jgi:equilibrative nucleoside transporter 1/2/3
MFLAAAPYFQLRFAESEWLLSHFQSAILTMFNLTNVACSWILAKMQRNASYPRRIIIAMILSMFSTTLLAISTNFSTPATLYFVFLMVMVHIASLATAFCQNGLLAFASSFGNTEYTQAIMTGQGIAGVLPCIVQIVAVLSVSEVEGEPATQQDPRSAFAFFITATAVVGGTLIAFLYLLRHNADRTVVKALATEGEEMEVEPERKVVGMLALLNKLRWLALGVSTVFIITMVYPVFSQAILSVRDPDTAPRLFQPAAFIPFAFLIWNTGDLIGRMLPLWPRISGIQYPKTIFAAAVARVVFIPLYELCNIKGRGAVVESDVFYLVVVQLLFGITGGYIGSTCMMAAPHWVDASEREAAGGFMGLMLVVGLTIGSLMSFTVSQA